MAFVDGVDHEFLAVIGAVDGAFDGAGGVRGVGTGSTSGGGGCAFGLRC